MSDTASFVAGRCGIQAKHKPHSGKRKDGTAWDCDGTMITLHAIVHERKVAPVEVRLLEMPTTLDEAIDAGEAFVSALKNLFGSSEVADSPASFGIPLMECVDDVHEGVDLLKRYRETQRGQ